MRRNLYRILWFVELVLLAVVALALILPVQDYSRREFGEWSRHPSPQTLEALQKKHQSEFGARASVAAPIAAVAMVLAFLLYRLRQTPER